MTIQPLRQRADLTGVQGPSDDLAIRLAEASGLVAAASGHVDRLAVESSRAQAQVVELTGLVQGLAHELEAAGSRLKRLEQRVVETDR